MLSLLLIKQEDYVHLIKMIDNNKYRLLTEVEVSMEFKKL